MDRQERCPPRTKSQSEIRDIVQWRTTMHGDENRDTSRPLQMTQKNGELLLVSRVETGQRLIEQKQSRSIQKRRCQSDPLAFSA